MKISEAFPSKYLKAADLGGRKVKVVIASVDREEIQTEHGKEEKSVMYFQGKSKGLVLNVTNGYAVAEAYGDETDDWAGHWVVLYPARVQFKQKMVDAIRIEIPAQQTATKPAPAPRHVDPDPPPVSMAEDMDDEIPF